MRKPEEIKKALRCRSNLWYCTLYACPYYFNSCLMCSQSVASDAYEYIHQLENKINELVDNAVLPEKVEQKWICVKDKLPDYSGIFLVRIHCGKGDWTEVDHFDHEEKEWWHDTGYSREYSTEYVVHWALIPEF